MTKDGLSGCYKWLVKAPPCSNVQTDYRDTLLLICVCGVRCSDLVMRLQRCGCCQCKMGGGGRWWLGGRGSLWESWGGGGVIAGEMWGVGPGSRGWCGVVGFGRGVRLLGVEGGGGVVSQMKLEPRGSCSTSVLYWHMWHLTSSVEFKRVL